MNNFRLFFRQTINSLNYKTAIFALGSLYTFKKGCINQNIFINEELIPFIKFKPQRVLAETNENESILFRNSPHFQMFYEHASLIYNGEPFMTPRNFIECVTSLKNSKEISIGINDTDLEKILYKTPYLGKTKRLFSDLGDSGIISFIEYLFLLSLLSRPQNGLKVAFKMFDKDFNEELDIFEFITVTKLHAGRKKKSISSSYENSVTKSTILRHLFGKNGYGKLKFKDFQKFVTNLQNEVLFVEFNQYTIGNKKISPMDLARSIVRYAELDKFAAKRAMERIHQRRYTYFNSDPNEASIDFAAYEKFFKFIFLIDDFESALSMFKMANKSVTKEEFQRAVRAVMGTTLDPLIVDTIYAMFDYNEDGCLNTKDLSSVLKSRLSRGADSINPALKFQYWPRFVARILRIKAVYRGEYLGWKILSNPNDGTAKPDNEKDTSRENFPLPVWRFSERSPWNVANRLSEFPFSDIQWCVVHPDGRKTAEKLKPYDGQIFKGDRVQVLIGPDKGKIGIVASVLKMRNLCFVQGLHTKIKLEKVSQTLQYRRLERPLRIDSEIALMDPEDNQPCETEWRFDEAGKQVRVSKRSGRIIPFPTGAAILDDLTHPETMDISLKDTTEDEANKVTFQIKNPKNKVAFKTFEEDISDHLKIPVDIRKRAETFWY